MDYQKDYYQVLGVDKQADEATIKKQYRKLALQFHPDKNPDDQHQFAAINEANQILSDASHRQDYDLKSPHGQHYNPFAQPMGGFGGFGGFGGDLFNIFSQFGFTSGFGRRQEFREQLDLALNLSVSLADVYNNLDIPVKYNRMVHCDTCAGTGFDPQSETFDCDICKGRGHDQYGRPCEYCQGTGKIHSGTCPTCKGNKVVSKEQEFRLNNIFRLRDHRTEFLQGYGHQSQYYRQKIGNLQLTLTFVNDHRYEIRDHNLYYKLNLHFQDAIDGYVLEHTHLDGKKMRIIIPERTKDKDLIRVQNQGLLVNPHERGHLIFDVNVIINYDLLPLNTPE